MVEAWYIEASANSLILKEKKLYYQIFSPVCFYYRLENMEKKL